MSEQSRHDKPINPDTLDRLADIACELDAGLIAGQESDEFFRRVQLYRRAAALEQVDPGQLIEFFESHLIKDCLGVVGDAEVGDDTLERHKFREILSDWLEALPENTLWKVRAILLPIAIKHVKNSPTADGLYLLSSIGYRDETVVSALRGAASGADVLAGTALRLMIRMGVQGNDKKWVREQIESRDTKLRISAELRQAIAALGDESAVDRFCQAGLDDEGYWLVFGELGWLCDHAPGDLELQDRVCDAMIRLAEARKNGWAELFFTGGGIKSCHTPRIVEGLVAQVPRVIGLGQVHFLRLMSRFEELISARQISGFGQVAAQRAVDALRPLAVNPTGSAGSVGMSFEDMASRNAWNLVLMLGAPDAAEWVADAVDNEVNTNRQYDLMKTAAVLSMPVLPSTAVSLLSSKTLAFTGGGDEPQLGSFLSAARLAGSSLTREAFLLLLGAGGFINASPLRSPVDHAAGLAIWMVEHEHPDILDELVAALRSPSPMACGVATRALLRLSRGSGKSLPKEALMELEVVSCDRDRPPYLRAAAINARAAAAQLSEPLIATLVELCEHENDQLHAAAANALIGAGLLDRCRDAIVRSAFHSSGGEVTTELTEELNLFEANLIGRLASIEPSVYAKSAGAIFEGGGKFSFAVSGIVRALLFAKRRGRTTPAEITDAIVQHIRNSETPWASNASLLDALAELEPVRLLNEPWQQIWSEWMSNSRQALADVIPGAVGRVSEESAKERGVALARLLLADGVFGVRRSAARALAELDQSALRATCEEYLSTGSIILRERAAEMAGWLPTDAENTMDNGLLRRLAYDSERRVRAAARRVREDARRRYWAAEHLRAVTEADSDPNRWVLRNYASGVALANVGDDHDMLALADRASQQDVPPNVRYWYSLVREKLESQWKKTTRKWPDPWLQWRGSIEKLTGFLVVGESVYAAQFALWRLPDDDDSGLYSWGGAASLQQTGTLSVLRVLLEHRGSTGLVRIGGRKDGSVLLTGNSGSDVLLCGSGSYPAKVERP